MLSSIQNSILRNGCQGPKQGNVKCEKVTEEDHEIKKLHQEIKSKPRGLAYMYRQKLEGLLPLSPILQGSFGVLGTKVAISKYD